MKTFSGSGIDKEKATRDVRLRKSSETHAFWKELSEQATAVVRLIVAVGVQLSIFIMVGLLVEQAVLSRNNIILCIACYIFVNVFIHLFFAKKELLNVSDKPINSEKVSEKSKNTVGLFGVLKRLNVIQDVKEVRQDIYASLLKSILSFCLFLVVGIVGGPAAPDGITALGVATGGFFGSVFISRM